MKIVETDRLILQEFSTNDADFVLQLLNEPAFHQYIGDKGVRTVDDAISYLYNGPIGSYKKYGYGLWLAKIKKNNTSAGMCGLKNRDVLEIPDLGYAFLKRYWSKGYATEAALGVINYAKVHLQLPRLVAITHPENKGSEKVLQKIGFQYKKVIHLESFKGKNKLFEIDLN